MAESYTAGSLLVRVVPDMRGSAAKIRKEFSGIGPFDVRVNAEVDDKAIKQLRATLRSLPDVVITADSSAADRDLAKLRARIVALSDHEIGVSLSADDARREIGDIRTDLDRLSDASVSVDADVGAARAALESVDRELSRIHGRSARAKVDLDTGVALTKVAAFQRQVGLIRDIRAAIVYDVRIGPALRQIALLNAALVGIPAVVGASVYSVASLGAALAPLVGTIGLLPAALGTAVYGFAALKIGMSGFGDAMKNIGDPKKFAEAIAELAPAARSAALAVAGLKPRFDELRTSVQDRLFSGMAAQITAIGNIYLPILDERFGRIADAANGAALSISLMLREGSRIADISAMGNSAAVVFENLFSALGPIVAAFVDIGAVGTPILAELTGGARGAALSFQQFIATARETGQLEEWIRGGLAALAQLGRIVGNIGSAFGGLFRAAETAGANFLGTLEMLTGTLSRFLNSAEGQTALVTLFRNIQGMTTAMRPGLEAVLGMIGDLITGLAPMLPQVGAAFSAVAEAARPLLGLLISLVSTVLPPLLDLITRYPGAFIGVALAIYGVVLAYRTMIAISGVIKGVQAGITAATWLMSTALWGQARAFVAAYWPIMLAVGLIALLVAGVIYAWNNFEWFRNVVMTVWNAIKIAFAAIGAAGMWLWHTILVPAFQAIGAAAMWLWTNAIKPAFDFIGLAARVLIAVLLTIFIYPLILAWKAVAAAAMWLWTNAIQPAFNAIGTFIVWVWTALIKPALDALVWFWQYVITPAALWLWNTIIKPTFQAIGAFIAWVWTNLILPALTALNWWWTSVIAPAAMWLWNTIIKPAFEGIGNVIRWVWENVISPAFEAIKSGLQWVGDKFNAVTDWIGDIWNKIRGYLAKPINFMIGTVWNEGIVPAWNWVAGLLGIGLVQPLPLIPEAATGGPVGNPAGGGTKRRQGGMLRGPGTGTSDSIMGVDARTGVPTSWVSNREFVVNEKISRAHRPFLEALNAGQAEARQAAGGSGARMPGYAGGGAVAESLDRARRFAMSQSGKPYQWGGTGNPSWDCSGFMGGITHELNGRSGFSGRIGTTATMPWGGFAPGLHSAFTIGNTKSGGHMAGTLDGVNVESGGSKGVHYGGPAIGADDGFFNEKYHLPTVGGAFVSGGGGSGGGFDYAGWLLNTFGRPLFFGATDPLIQGLRDFIGPPPPAWRDIPPGFVTKVRDDIWAWTERKVREAFPGGGGGGVDISGITGPVVDQVRQVADRYGWGAGPEWDAILRIVDKESSWDPGAANSRSSARGLFQKMTSVHGPVEPTPAGQANWGLNYIRERYGSPTAAWAFHQANGHYASGGMVGANPFDSGGVARGTGIMFKDVIADERVLDPEATEDYDVLSDYRRMLDDGRLVPARGLDARQLAAMGAGASGPGGREMHLHVHGDVNDPMDVDSLYNQIDWRERSTTL